MLKIKKEYIITDDNKKKAVLIDKNKVIFIK